MESPKTSKYKDQSGRAANQTGCRAGPLKPLLHWRIAPQPSLRNEWSIRERARPTTSPSRSHRTTLQTAAGPPNSLQRMSRLMKIVKQAAGPADVAKGEKRDAKGPNQRGRMPSTKNYLAGKNRPNPSKRRSAVRRGRSVRMNRTIRRTKMIHNPSRRNLLSTKQDLNADWCL